MPHADSLALPEGLSKRDFYCHVNSTLSALLTPSSPSDPTNFITCFSNAASLLFGSYENYTEGGFGKEDGKRVNWAGFYLIPSLLTRSPSSDSSAASSPTQLFLGPFHGRPACLSVSLTAPSRSRPVGVCAASFLENETVVVPDVEKRPGHIACDGVTKSEIVVPISIRVKREGKEEEEEVKIGVLDIDCERLEAFDEVDKEGLEEFVEVLKKVINWEL
ncbi:L-methionine (R)-S-oxide reductase [Sporobolomyces salmoneus]|uniref:L-methionine (R)-S-oxide reductase n=1 Tax=Sporobolomyces salmoneus TaxID=183962 RepID=UPI003176D5D9